MSKTDNSSSPTKNAPLACIVLAAGKGTRMKSRLPKVMHQVAGLPMISHVINACADLLPQHIITVISPDADLVAKAVAPHKTVIQREALGTANAVLAAQKVLKDFSGDILVVFGDTPLITSHSLNTLRQKKQDARAPLAISGFRPQDPAAYGRLVVDQHGKLHAIVETAEATTEQKAIGLCNGGIMLVDAALLWKSLAEVKNNNSKGEYYLTDCVAIAGLSGHEAVVAELDELDVMGINTRVELAAAEAAMQQRLRTAAMLAGVTMQDPGTVYLSADTRLGQDVTIGPNVVFGPGVEVGSGVTIRAFCQLDQVRVDDNAVIGPFARLRPGSVVGEGAHVGNFVEIKNTQLGKGAKVNHLSYLGDATIGDKANIGAGTITCNYDGFRKFHTDVGAGAFVGSNTALVAPVKIGEGAYVGAGSVITNEVPAHTLAVARGRQSNIDGWAKKFRDSKAKE